LRELGFNQDAGGYITGDLCLRAPHLFDGSRSSIWPTPRRRCRSSGAYLVGRQAARLTYVPEQEVGAWHQHDTEDGVFEYICAVPENGADVLYASSGATALGTERFIERMEPRQSTDSDSGFFVDCGLSYSGAPATVFSGLDHLSGKDVVVLADGGVVEGLTVAGGSITLADARKRFTSGCASPATSDAAGRVRGAGLRAGPAEERQQGVAALYSTRDVKAGRASPSLREYSPRTTEPYDSPPALITGEIGLSLTPSWSADGGVCIRHDEPLPFTLLSITPEHAIGG
jgi:hypothetical protein